METDVSNAQRDDMVVLYGDEDRFLTLEQLGELQRKVPKSEIQTRAGAGNKQFSYIDKEYVIEQANRVFGPANWSRRTSGMTLEQNKTCVMEIWDNAKKARVDKPGIVIVASCKVEVEVLFTRNGVTRKVVKEGYGLHTGMAADDDKGAFGQLLELCYKGAETDALKKAFTNFGPLFGLGIEDKAAPVLTEDGPGALPPAGMQGSPNGAGGNAGQKPASRQAPPASGGASGRQAPPAAATPQAAATPPVGNQEQAQAAEGSTAVDATPAERRPEPVAQPQRVPDARPQPQRSARDAGEDRFNEIPPYGEEARTGGGAQGRPAQEPTSQVRDESRGEAPRSGPATASAAPPVGAIDADREFPLEGLRSDLVKSEVFQSRDYTAMSNEDWTAYYRDFTKVLSQAKEKDDFRALAHVVVKLMPHTRDDAAGKKNWSNAMATRLKKRLEAFGDREGAEVMGSVQRS